MAKARRRRFSVLVIVTILASCSVAASIGGVFSRGERSLTLDETALSHSDLGEVLFLNSFGAALIDDNSLLDVYTTNHSFASRYLINQGEANFSDRRIDLGLSSNADFVGAEPSTDKLRIDDPGLYFYWRHGSFHVASKGLVYSKPKTILLTLNGGIVWSRSGELEVLEHEEEQGAEFPTRILVEFKGNGELVLNSLRWEVNGSVKLDPEYDLDEVFVGSMKSRAERSQFELSGGADLHGIVWSDLNHDGNRDAVFVDGGESGMARTPTPYRVAFGTGQRYGRVGEVDGLIKEMCPTRQVITLDANGDQLLDIYVVCGRYEPPRVNHPNELFVRLPLADHPMAYRNEAAEMGLDLPGAGLADWFDYDDDGVPELLWVTSNAVEMYDRNPADPGSKYTRIPIGASDSRPTQIARGDIEGDGDIDAYVVGIFGSSFVLVNDGGKLSMAPPEDFGLPRDSRCANFVDIDNDGNDEFHALPGGLYRFSGTLRWEPTGAFAGARPERLLASPNDPKVWCLWFDANNDGYRDLLTALPTHKTSKDLLDQIKRRFEGWRYAGRYQARIFRPPSLTISLTITRPSGNNWLEVDLVGPPGNPDAVGATVTVEAGGDRFQRVVAHADGATTSSGHHRLYFGLGRADAIDTLRITWPDGRVQNMSPPPVNELFLAR